MAAPTVTRNLAHELGAIADGVLFIGAARRCEKFQSIVTQRQNPLQAKRHPEETVPQFDVVMRATDLCAKRQGRIEAGLEFEMTKQAISISHREAGSGIPTATCADALRPPSAEGQAMSQARLSGRGGNKQAKKDE